MKPRSDPVIKIKPLSKNKIDPRIRMKFHAHVTISFPKIALFNYPNF